MTYVETACRRAVSVYPALVVVEELIPSFVHRAFLGLKIVLR